MTRKQTSNDETNNRGTVIKLETLHIAAAPLAQAKRRLRLLPGTTAYQPIAA